MEIQRETIIGDIVTKNYQYASILKKHNIDFCCKGGRKLEEACDESELQSIISELNSHQSSGADEVKFTSWPLDLLADYVERIHHQYVVDKTPEIKMYVNKIAKVHGSKHPELIELEEHFNEMSTHLAAHMKKEELMLFPHIKKLVKNPSDTSSPFGSIENPIAKMMAEHETEGERYERINEITNNLTPPDDACNTYKVCFSLLKEFENDLNKHIHLENNILFPKAIELEKQN